ncbi:solute carrier family 22 member 12-like [Dromiciops gliroides]|uniref:solute carrier family 22 member 12-like n=1 Tax=Dromiciops gliroides TaxID=33562 RepID=UPI001CC42C18|nr:solute carrier family 22 member 12-like [Dromiciops gliroides]
MGFSELLGTIGGIGHFQVLQIALMFIIGILFTCQNYIENFTAVVPEHHCRLQNQTSVEAPFLGDGSNTDLLNVSIPMDKHGKPETCLRFTELQWQLLNPNATEQTRLDTEDCLDGWVYDKSVFSSSIVIECLHPRKKRKKECQSLWASCFAFAFTPYCEGLSLPSSSVWLT